MLLATEFALAAFQLQNEFARCWTCCHYSIIKLLNNITNGRCTTITDDTH